MDLSANKMIHLMRGQYITEAQEAYLEKITPGDIDLPAFLALLATEMGCEPDRAVASVAIEIIKSNGSALNTARRRLAEVTSGQGVMF
jgi:hypothetical protein